MQRIAHKDGFRRDGDIWDVLQDLKAKRAFEGHYFKVLVHGKRYILAKAPLYIFRDDWPALHSLRLSAIWITEWRWFERMIIAVIAMNCVTMALPVAYDPDSATEGEREFLLICNVITMMIFTVECILKIVSRGLILSNAPDVCYLREPMNWLDLAVVITSVLELFVLGEDNSESKGVLLVRALRVLRPLRTIQVLPSLRMIINTLVESAPLIGHWLIFLGVNLGILAIAGMNLFGTVYWQRCRLTQAPVPSAGGGLEWPMDPAQTRFCGGRHTCGPAASGQATYCETPVDVGRLPPAGLDPWPDISTNPGADFGIIGFQNFGASLLTVFQVATIDNWTELLYRYQDGTGTVIAVLFFLLVVLFSGLVLLNMAPAILWERFSDILNKVSPVDLRGESAGAVIPEDILSMKMRALVQEFEQRNKELKKRKVKEQVNDLTGLGLKPVCLWICSQPWFENFFLFLVIVNAVILALDSYPAPDPSLVKAWGTINVVCSFLFIVEVSIKMIGKGVSFWADHLNVFDFVLVAVSLIEIFQTGTGSVSALRTARLLRILNNDIFGVNVAKRVLLRVVHKAIIPTYSFAAVVLACLYCVTLLGLQLFFPREHAQIATASTFPRFDSLLYAFLSVFALLSGDDWSRSMVQHAHGSSEAPTVIAYHISVLIICRLVLMSFLVAIFAVCFAQAREELLIEYRVKLARIRHPPEEPPDTPKVTATPANEEDDVPEPDSPLWPKDILDSREGHTKTHCRGMNVFRMMRIKQAAADRRLAAGGEVTFGKLMPGKANAKAVSAAEEFNKHRTEGRFDAEAPRRSIDCFAEAAHGAAPPSPSASHAPADKLLGVGRPRIPLLQLEPESVLVGGSGEVACGAACAAAPAGALGLRRRTRRHRLGAWAEPPAPTLCFKELVQRAKEEAEPPLEVARTWREAPAASAEQQLVCQHQDAELPADREAPAGGTWPPRRWEAAAVHGAPPRPPELGQDGGPPPSAGGSSAWSSRCREATPAERRPLPRPAPLSVGPRGVEAPAGPPPPPSEELAPARPPPQREAAPAHRAAPRPAPAPLASFESEASSRWVAEDDDRPVRPPAPPPPGYYSASAYRIVSSQVFEPMILVLIVISNVCLAFETPFQDPAGNVGIILAVVDIIAVTAFTVEMLLRMVAFGLFTPPSGYFCSAWNWIDFVCAVTGVVDTVFLLLSLEAPGTASLKLLRSLRVLRVLRPFRFVKRYRGVKILVEALLNSVPTLLNVVFIVLLFYLGFGILLVNILKGQLWHCSLDPTGELRPEIVTREDCIAAGGQWVNAISNFDHIGNSFVTLIHLGTGEGWIDVMLTVSNSAGVNLQPRSSHNVYLSLLVIGFVAMSRFVLLNLFIGVLIDAYMVAKHELDGVDLLSWDERRWIRMQQGVFFNPNVVLPPEARLKGERWLKQRQRLLPIVESKIFEAILLLCIVGNFASACAIYPMQSQAVLTACQVGAIVFSLFITVEVSLKIFVFQHEFFQDTWNAFALVVTFGADLSAFVDLGGVSGNEFAGVLRIFRVLRILRFAKQIRFQRALLQTMRTVLPGLAHVAALLALVLFMYACMGVGLFGTVSNGDALGHDANFNGFMSAFLLLIRAATGERWHLLLYDIVEDKPGCIAESQSPEDLARDGPRGCGSPLGYPYFVAFLVTVTMTMYFIVAVVLDGFYEVYQIYSMFRYEILARQFTKAWLQMDTLFTGYLSLDDVVRILQEVEQPVGYGGGGGRSTKRHILHQMRYIRIFAGRKVHFRDVILLCARRSCCWLKRDYERNVYQVQFETELLDSWHATFADFPVPQSKTDVPEPISPKMPTSPKFSARSGFSGRTFSMRGGQKSPVKKGTARSTIDLSTPGTEEDDPLSQMAGHAVASAAAHDENFKLLIGHLIVAVTVSNLIARKRRMWRKNLGRRPSQCSNTPAHNNLSIALATAHRLKVSIVRATGLRRADWFGSSDAYCKCTILGNERHWIQTPVISALDPKWDFQGEMPNFHEGESLLFEVLDQDVMQQADFLGRAVLDTADFFPNGFQGDLKLEDTGGEEGTTAWLRVKVELMPPEDGPAKPQQKERKKSRRSSNGGGAQAKAKPEDPATVPQANIICTELLPLNIARFQKLSPLPWPPPLPEGGSQ